MGRSIKALNAICKIHPMVLSCSIDRHARLRKIRICKGTDSNGHHIRNGIQSIKNGGTTLRAKVEPNCGAIIADAHIFLALALDNHCVSRESRLNAKHTAGTLLARQAMAD